MGLVIEDGTGIANANGYITVIELKAYWATRGVTLTETDAVLESWIILATEYVDNNYDFYGSEYTEIQALLFPRTLFYNTCNNREVSAGTIPDALKNTVAFLARQTDGSTLDANIDSGLKSKSVGPVSVSFSGSSAGATKIYKQANKYMNCISSQPGSRPTRC